MSLQIFLEGRFQGMERFLAEAPDSSEAGLEARALWLSLVSEVLPRALLRELNLSPILLGFSSSGYFLLVLPEEARTPAQEFLDSVAADIAASTTGQLRLTWAATENLGEWGAIRKRLEDELLRKANTPLAAVGLSHFDAQREAQVAPELFGEGWLEALRRARSIGWTPEHPARVTAGEGKHQWPLTDSHEAISFARHAALSDDQQTAATLKTFAARSTGGQAWGVLRGNVDNFLSRLSSAGSIEDYVRISVVFKQFFAGELEVACSLPAFWQKTTVLYTGGDEFAVTGSWDALIALGEELERLLARFTSEILAAFPGPEAKTITMALVLGHVGDSLGEVYREAGRKLDAAKALGKGRFHLFGRSVEWKELGEAEGLAGRMTKMVEEFGCTPEFLDELAGFYRESLLQEAGGGAVLQRRERRFERPWRFHRRLNRVLEPAIALGNRRSQEFERRKTGLIDELISRGSAGRRLRPAGRVSLEWARLATGRAN